VYQSGLVEGVDQTVFWNPRGELTETQSMNLAVKLGGEWLTPPLSSGLLPGTYRAHLLEKGLLREQVLFVADLEKGQELAFFNSVRRWKKGKPLRPTLR
jgi:para-aminobenzoate synthetase/4-amino-4-deoxychorismate lyase